MATFCFRCLKCDAAFQRKKHLATHYVRTHHSQDSLCRSTFRFHPRLTASKCDENGNNLPPGAPPPPQQDSGPDNWFPFEDRSTFHIAELLFKKVQMSAGDIDNLLEFWAARSVSASSDLDGAPFRDAQDLYNTIDLIEHGDAPWESFEVRYSGPVVADSPTWKQTNYRVYYRNTRTVAHNMLKNPDFDKKIDYTVFQEYTGPGQRQYSNLMLGDWAWNKSTTIAEADQAMHRSMLVPIILGADKTTVSVATGQNDFHPVYMSLGNVHNSVRRVHRDALLPIAFLAIPKACRKEEDTDEFWIFQKQVYHASLAKILSPLRAAMTTPEVVWCPDGHYHCAIYELGLFIADYPEQVVLAGIVQGWCPRCQATPEQLDFCYLAHRSAHNNDTLSQMQEALTRFHEHRTIFEDTGIHPDGFSLPRQHTLNHYIDTICNFGSPNGICSSITESKHIRAVKEPWHHSSKNNAIGQMLLTNQHLDKLVAACADFKKRNMFWGSVLGQALQAAGQVVEVEVAEDELDVMDIEGPPESSSVTLTARQEFSCPIEVIVDQLQQPDLPELIQCFLYDQLYSNENLPSSDVPLADCPSFAGCVKIFHSARATFHAPNKLSGLGGMHREIIQSNPSWQNEYERYDTVLIDRDADQDGM
ncbi:hypothetical protein JAAARDRAFT_196095 [Jaapia argillacea MUCL 33604]|uniref:C2H2-type domain-containing protein n=1 Tax=Jaapia argillacea MUCL 33604 TaxID=933084 RepID=A0A067PN66_9AGAM|nr:hypothetical protein JAAARDRAFT_196095 [Jaapia argillacea MUCL 33604]